MNINASELGKLAKGKKKTLSEKAIIARRNNWAKARMLKAEKRNETAS